MQRFRQPQKMQGPLFPIEDDELIDEINDYKNIPDDDSVQSKTDSLINEFNAENHVEVIEVNDMYMDNSDYIDENEDFTDKDDKENVFRNIKNDTEKTVNMFCKLYFLL